jgi:hypothetical protein
MLLDFRLSALARFPFIITDGYDDMVDVTTTSIDRGELKPLVADASRFYPTWNSTAVTWSRHFGFRYQAPFDRPSDTSRMGICRATPPNGLGHR